MPFFGERTPHTNAATFGISVPTLGPIDVTCQESKHDLLIFQIDDTILGTFIKGVQLGAIHQAIKQGKRPETQPTLNALSDLINGYVVFYETSTGKFRGIAVSTPLL